ncbi:C1QL [Mytilus edulis]|uniref:C1QL n=1 Tax=Mytilus edulis TaxID=6550 RepID=A0A8S3RSU8_MYTED|nr:C1QL [Mytilus edulis]
MNWFINGSYEKERAYISHKGVNMTYTKPAFFAVLISAGENFGNEQILKFDSVKTNIGGGYDPITGVFIAPKDGTYQFTGVIYSNGQGADIEAQMNKNHELLLRGYSSGASHAESQVMSGVVTLKTGDHIFIQHRGPAVDNAQYNSSYWLNFIFELKVSYIANGGQSLDCTERHRIEVFSFLIGKDGEYYW